MTSGFSPVLSLIASTIISAASAFMLDARTCAAGSARVPANVRRGRREIGPRWSGSRQYLTHGVKAEKGTTTEWCVGRPP